jgi:hypothetical protein
LNGSLLFEDGLHEMKPPFPTGKEPEETVAVMRLLEAATEPVSIVETARHFAQGKQIEKRFGLVVAALAGLGICLRRMVARPFRCEAPLDSEPIFGAPPLSPSERFSVVPPYGPCFSRRAKTPVPAHPERLQGRFKITGT